MLEYYAFTRKGNKSGRNEDRILIDDYLLSEGFREGKKHNHIISIICDGVGGRNSGDVAAEITAGSFKFYDVKNCSPASITNHLHVIDRKLNELQKNNVDYEGMATTVAGLIISGNNFLAFNTGDTRIYHFHDHRLELLTTDHTKESPFGKSHTLTGYIGGDGRGCLPSLRKGEAMPGHIFLSCSDGIYRSISDSDLSSIIDGNLTLGQKCRAILEQIGPDGSDDISILLISMHN